MRTIAALIAALALVAAPMGAYAKGKSGGSRPHYSGSKHTASHGGHYQGGRGQSHKGGEYKNSKTGNQYGKHK